jgi:hypothetical protein
MRGLHDDGHDVPVAQPGRADADPVCALTAIDSVTSNAYDP